MSSKRTQIILLITVTQLASIGFGNALRTATPDDPAGSTPQPARPTIHKPITREDAELMLREAHGAIEQGRLDEAEKIVSRVEDAHVQFPFFHVGPTDASLRRELTRAQRLRAASKSLSHDQPAGPTRYLPFSRSSSGRPSVAMDPFTARNATAGQLSPPTSTASPPIPQAVADRGSAGISASAVLPSSSQPSHGSAIDNPFASAGITGGLNSARPIGNLPSTERPLNYPTAHAAADEYPPRTAPRSTPAISALSPNDATGPNSHWTLPDAPLPRGLSDQQIATASAELTPPRRSAADPPMADSRPPNNPSKQQAQEHLSAARKALVTGNIDLAEKLTQAANSLGVPESQYLPDEDRPSLVAWDIAQAKQKENRPPQAIARLPNTSSRYDTRPTPSHDPTAWPDEHREDAMQAEYRVENGDQQLPPKTPIPPRVARPSPALRSSAAEHQDQAESGPLMVAALPKRTAEESPKAEVAAPPAEDLPLPPPADNSAATATKDWAKQEAPAAVPSPSNNKPPSTTQQPAATQPPKSLIDTAGEAQQILARKLSAEIGKRQSEAIRLREKDSERALATLREAQQLVNESKLPESSRRELLSRIDKTLHDTQEYVKAHSAEIELDKRNEAVRADVDRDRDVKLKLQQKIAELVEEFNRLNHEQRYAEAEIIARRLNELAPNDPVAAQVWQNAKFIRREMMNRQLVDKKENSVWEQLNAVEESAVNPVAADGHELVYDQKKWRDFIPKRKGSKERVQRHTERELEIERRLQTPVLLRYDNTPLSEVMHGLSELTSVNIHLDPRGLSQEGVNSDTPVTINLSKEISLKSALNLILEPLHLSYVVSDEVLKITSEQLRDGELYTQTYNVADLVTPIPNFVPSNNIGLQGLINESMAAAGRGQIGVGSGGPTVLVNDRGQKPATGPNGKVLAQQLGSTPANGLASSSVPIGAGPGGMGAGANADFDSLIDLITATVANETWAENGGGQAEIRPFPTNLSLVISQTQAVHEQIADLLQQLRRLQDLQVTIEVRFIRLNDSFFERIGIDFDMNVKDHGVNPNNTTNNPFQPIVNTNGVPGTLSNTVGLQRPVSPTNPFPNFTSDLDIPFRQNSFDLTQVVPFGGPVDGGLNFGFAILSDIEAFFLIEAAQGDRRTNVLNAPKVTLFNGQQAFVADATQRPFVVGVIPVVGEFAAAQQPVIVVLNEGTMMTIQAVVSDDRRYVRMTIVPFFTQIGNVDTFTFEGSSSSTSSSSSATDKTGDDTTSDKKDDSSSDNHTGVTVQLPSFSFVSVVTTVSVPDGGTVLLGGIKRLSEGRNEFGVPLLSKVPYINRLFKNVAIGRETDSLMMMVTPRIIIQEEEEERLGIAVP